MQRIIEPAADGKPERWGTLRSAHATGNKIYPKQLSYVVTRDGTRIIAGRGASASAIDALTRNARAAERDEGNDRREWRGRKAA